jgi:lyso-ornithine lipid O-acyltransferase
MQPLLRFLKICLLAGLNLAFFFTGLSIDKAGFIRKEKRIRMAASCARLWARGSCRLLGLYVKQSGMIPRNAPYFVVSNHCSYLDVIVLGSVIENPLFIAKKEVASWFFIGWLVRLAGTVFIDRASKTSLSDTITSVKERLDNGVNVILFPEGTTGDGIRMKEFRSSFFKAPSEMEIPILPVSLAYQYIDGIPVGGSTADKISWHGDMTFLPHFWDLLSAKKIEARVHFNPAISHISSDENVRTRKILCQCSYDFVKEGLDRLRLEMET